MMNFDLAELLKTLPAVIIGLTIHEYAHAWTALDRISPLHSVSIKSNGSG
jgi:hypothetical protein